MSILLIGDLTKQEYEEWGYHLTACLPMTETLVLANVPFDAAAVTVALVANPPLGSLAEVPNLRLIQSLWAGVDKLLADPTLPSGVPIARLVDPNLTQAMVECVLAGVLSLHRRFPAYARQQTEGLWNPLLQPVAAERRVSLLGLGRLGQAAAQALRAVGFPISGWTRTARDTPGVVCHAGPGGLAQMLTTTDILVNLLPLTGETAGILGGSTFDTLPHGASLINLARGGHLVEDDLLSALSTGQIEHAMLDVFHQEPLPPGHPFWSHPNITVFPHVAAATSPATAARIAAVNVAALHGGRPLQNIVDRHRGY